MRERGVGRGIHTTDNGEEEDGWIWNMYESSTARRSEWNAAGSGLGWDQAHTSSGYCRNRKSTMVFYGKAAHRRRLTRLHDAPHKWDEDCHCRRLDWPEQAPNRGDEGIFSA